MPPASRPVCRALCAAIVLGWMGLNTSPLAARRKGSATPDPEITIPTCPKAPKIDGRIGQDEWRFAAAVSLFEQFPTGLVQMEQPIFYVCRHGDDLYVAMDSIDSNTNTIVAACMQHDHMRIIGDDCMEFMLAPGAGKDVDRFDFPTFYFALNAIGTVWDAKFIPLCAEMHNSWENGGQWQSTVDGTHWMCELRVPLRNISPKAPRDGQTWRINFDRTFHGYKWLAWRAGGLNDARTGGNATFDSTAPAVRIVDPSAVADGKLRLLMEVANGTREAQTVTARLACKGQQGKDAKTVPVGAFEKTVTVKPGEVAEVVLGPPRGAPRLLPYNRLVLEATGAGGKRLLFMERVIQIPVPRFVRRPARKVPLVYVFPRFLPSLERLATTVNYTAWAKKTTYIGPPPKAHVRVFRKGEQDGGKPVMQGVLEEFKDYLGVLRMSTAKLPEGNYVVKVRVAAPSGETIAEDHDWFEKRIFDWVKNKRGVGPDVPRPYTPLVVRDSTVRPWGRTYRFAANGLPAQVVSQKRSLLAGPVELQVTRNGKTAALRVDKPMRFTAVTPPKVSARADLRADGLRVGVASTTEYDGFTLFRLTYGPASKPVAIDGMRLRIPYAAKYAKFYSAAGDTQGVTINGEVLPVRQGKILDSKNDLRSVCCAPTFASLFWVADHETCFCYCGDSDQGWILPDDKPGLEVVREGDVLAIYLNFVARKATLTKARTLEFGLQAGPLKPRPEGWRGIQFRGNPDDAPTTWAWTRHCCAGLTGGVNIQHPGDTPELRKKAAEIVGKWTPKTVPVGYNYYATVPKGRPATRVYRGEWGIDRYTWDAAKRVQKWQWSNRRFGDNKDLYILMYVRPCPSYIDFLAYAWDETLKYTEMCGHYDDVGTPRTVFDEELGIGYVREDGRKISSAGIWVYRERWKRNAYLLYKHGRPNFLADSQHVRGHYMPAYGFIGVWAPCEKGYYNPFADRDNLGFYRSLGRYAAYNPATQFGQVPAIGMSSPHWQVDRKARDARCMMMLCLLHDHDTGSWGSRYGRTIAAVRYSRNLFKPWAKDVKFLGYWKSPEWVACDRPDARVSAWHNRRGALFVVGNVGDKPVQAVIDPNWKRFGLPPGNLVACDAENGDTIPLDAGASGKGFRVAVGRHDLRLVLVGRPGRFNATRPELGKDLPGPKQVIPELSDAFTGPKLASAWKKDLHEGHAGAGILDGRLYIQGCHYGYAHVRREFGQDNVSVQVLMFRGGTGGSDDWNGALTLWWANGQYAQAIAGTGRKKFIYTVSGRRRLGSPINQTTAPGWFPNWHNWVKIALRPQKIVFYGSADGKTWIKDWEFRRTKALAGAPQYLLLGNGARGKNPYLNNVHSQHFRPRGRTVVTYFSDLVVGRD